MTTAATTASMQAVEGEPTRTAAVWCPDWPVAAAATAAEVPDNTAIAVMTANRVVACNQVARAHGVRRDQLRREAQYRCPGLVLLPRDESAEARLFEPVAVALESVAPGVEITRPGLAALRVRGPARFYGSEEGVVSAVGEAVNALTEGWVGVADGAFAAALAARRGIVVPPGGSADFLHPMPITVLGSQAGVPLVDLLLRLGISTLGAFAALPAADVSARFGAMGAWAHRLAGARDIRPVAARQPPLECSVEVAFEPPLDRADAVAFSSRVTAEQFIDRLGRHGLACVCFEAQVDTDCGEASGRGEQLVRRWRHTGLLTAVEVVDRIRWQLEGQFSSAHRDDQISGAVTRLRLVPIETVPTGAHQQALWGGPGEGDERVERGLARVQTQLGHESVVRLSVQGGSSPAARTARTVWGEPVTAQVSAPWPGHLPAPAPTLLVDPPHLIEVLDHSRRAVRISERGTMTASPAVLRIAGRDPVGITAWAGPWPQSEAWWEPGSTGRVLRCQLVDVHGRAYVVVYCLPDTNGQGDRWLLEGMYD